MDDTDTDTDESSQTSEEHSYSDENETSEVWSDDYDETSDWESDETSSEDVSDEENEMDDGSSESIDPNPITALELEEIASINIAIALWKHASVYKMETIANNDKWQNSMKQVIPYLTKQLPIPKLLTKRIENLFNSMLQNVNAWISYIYREVFFKHGNKSDLYRLINGIIFHYNGAIDYKKTALSLIESDKLTTAEKYRIACTYCLKEEIVKRCPSPYEACISNQVQFSRYPLLFYWNCYLDDELESIYIPEDISLNEYMMQQRRVNNWPALEYFFNRLSVEEQVSSTIWLIDECEPSYQKFLLLKLNETQRLHVYADKAVQIIMNYVYSKRYRYEAILTWYSVRDLITPDEFVSLFEDLLEVRADDIILTEIWINASDKLKIHLLNHDNYSFLKNLLNWWWEQDKDGDFLSSVLLDPISSIVKRDIAETKFFKKYCEKFISGDELKLLDRLLNFCLPTKAELIKFKRVLAKCDFFTDRCKTLITDGRIQALDRLLRFCFAESDIKSTLILRNLLHENLKHIDQKCLTYYSSANLKELNKLLAPLISSYPEIILEYKSNLLLSDSGIKTCTAHFNSTDVLTEIIFDGLPTTRLANDFKKMIIFSFESFDKLQCLIMNESLNNAIKVISWFLESDAERSKLKSQLINYFVQQMRNCDAQLKDKYVELLSKLF